MQSFLNSISNIFFGFPLALIILFIGVYLTFNSRGFQFFNLKHIFNSTLFCKNKKESGGISPFAALTTSLAASIGTGNIVGVTAAIAVGGAGAVFWMWLSGIFGMMTAFFENALAVKYRLKDSNNQSYGGAFAYLKFGIKNKRVASILATGFAFFCVLSSFTMGNMVQVSSAAAAAKNLNISITAFSVAVFIFCLLVTVKGIKSISKATSIIVPIMSAFYIIIGLYIIIINFNKLPLVITSIFKGAFGFNSAVGGFCGAALKNAITVGFKRGVFSNEAGLGSTTIAAASSNEKDPVKQGMWGILQVFFDTIVICTLTAFIVLLSVSEASIKGMGAVEIISLCFYNGFGNMGGTLLSVMIILFSLSTVIGWSYFGLTAAEFLFGKKISVPYKIIYSLVCILGCNITVNSCFLLADIFNGFMAIFNIIGLIILSRKEIKDIGLNKL